MTTGLPAGSNTPPSSPHASQLDNSLPQMHPDLTELPSLDSASLGNYLRFMCVSARSQSEMIMQLEDVSRRQNKLIHQLQNKVEIMSRKLQPGVRPPVACQHPSPPVDGSVCPSPPGPSRPPPSGHPAIQRYPALPQTEPTAYSQQADSFPCPAVPCSA